ncbi:MAG: DUF4234 domain-containing protein [bacterium]|nr:DUF4234 domain-containing protein [bacterium]
MNTQVNTPVKYRDMLVQVGLMIVTLGLYAVYWFYQTSIEMAGLAGDRRAEPALWTILLFVPFAGLYSYYKHAELYEVISPDRFNRWLMWIFWIVFAPAAWFIIQLELNRKANYGDRVI